jgi:TonB family protein
MTHDPRVRAAIDAIRAGDQEPLDYATAVFTVPPKLTQVAQTLAANGGGALSVDLALDLVLNDLVEQARNVTGATGAAIAMFRDGKLTCRASSGENAPDLGVPVDASSGLAGACVGTGEIQQCQDTEADGRVNAESCRRLGVRSMLIAPLVDGQTLVGLIQVFSPWPNAFGKREISALQVLAGRVAESNREAEAVITTPVEEPEAPVEEPETPAEPAEITFEPIPYDAGEDTGEEQPEQLLEKIPAAASAPRKGFDLSGTVLVMLVMAAAIALGLVIGWRRAAEPTKPARQANSSAHADDSSNLAAPAPTPSQNGVTADRTAPSASQNGVTADRTGPTASQNGITADPIEARTRSAAVFTTKALVANPEPPPGGLIVTQNGRVVYRSPSGGGQPAAGQPTERRLIHRVEPEYPAEAEAHHVEGPVVLDVQVLDDGEVGTIAIVSGDPVLAQSAVDAVKQWRYRPGVQCQTRVTVKYTLPQS